MCSSILINKHKINVDIFRSIIKNIIFSYISGFVDPGKSIGVVSAQAIQEGSTQGSLSAFHVAGIKQEDDFKKTEKIIHLANNINMVITIDVVDKYNRDMNIVSKISNSIEYCNINMIYDNINVLSDYNMDIDNRKININSFEEDRDFINKFQDYTSPIYDDEKTDNGLKKIISDLPFCIRIKFDENKFAHHGLELSYISTMIKEKIPYLIPISSDEMLSKHNLTIRLYFDKSKMPQVKSIKELLSVDNIGEIIKETIKNILNIKLKGIVGINNAIIANKNINKYDKKTGKHELEKVYYLKIFGNNMVDIALHPLLVSSSLKTNDIVGIFENYGIERARQAIYDNLVEIGSFGKDGTLKHQLHLLADLMTSFGLISITRYGIAKVENSTTNKSTFEESLKHFTTAALKGSVDRLNNNASSIMFGKELTCGTGMNTITQKIKQVRVGDIDLDF